MKCAKCLILLTAVACVLSGCRKSDAQFSQTYYGAFDTVVALTTCAPDRAAFDRIASDFSDRLFALHAAFDRYQPHPGVNGLYALNAAGGQWVEVEPELYDLLLKCREWRALGGERVNPALGNLFELWHRFRDAGEGVPSPEALEAAAGHSDFSALELEGGRARLSDPEVTLDLGAVAKGYAAGLLGELVSGTTDCYLIDAGGNVVAGRKPGGAWRVGVRNPDGGDVLAVLNLTDACAVTSGDYQRYYEVDGVRYHHLIDPDTRMPGHFMRQVTVLAGDSGYADYLSTLLFLSPPGDALALAEALEGVEAIFVLNDGTIQRTSGVGGLVSG